MPGAIRKRGVSSWELRIDAGRHPETGRRLFQYKTVRGTRKQANAALTQMAHERDNGLAVMPDRVTVSEFLDRWLDRYASNNVAPSTQQRYRQFAKRLKPFIGTIRLQALKPMQVQEAHGRLLSEGLSDRTVLHTHRMLRQALSHAVRWQVLARNPADAVTPRRATDGEVRYLRPEEVHRLLDACDDEQLWVILYIAVATGMRRGEILGATSTSRLVQPTSPGRRRASTAAR